jgi:hypothetical protein
MKSIVKTLSLAAAGLLTTAVVMAADAPASAPGGGQMAACIADFQRLCPGTEPGNGAVKACLKTHRKDLSNDCKQEIKAARNKKSQSDD